MYLSPKIHAHPPNLNLKPKQRDCSELSPKAVIHKAYQDCELQHPPADRRVKSANNKSEENY